MSSNAGAITLSSPCVTVMERLEQKSLLRASQEGRFVAHDSEYHVFRSDQYGGSSHETFSRKGTETNDDLPAAFTAPAHLGDSIMSRFRLQLQRTRPQHVSGTADKLPFEDLDFFRKAFDILNLPRSYLQIADGFLASAQTHVFHDKQGQLTSLEMIVYSHGKQGGHWSLAISHQASTMDTSVFCSLDHELQPQLLVDDLVALQSYSFHPMLVPCIMFESILSMGIDRRYSIKRRLRMLERTVVGVKSDADSDLHFALTQNLFDLLNGCRKDQASCEGRYEFWRSYHTAVQLGLKYTGDLLMATNPLDNAQIKAHHELGQWVELTWQKLNSLIARDKDHINRVQNVSTLLYNLVQQRDSRLQSGIARAAQRDSEDMKFIALLGSVFLPASLIASIFNVPSFQFLTGAKLFGAYLGITVPLIALVVVFCMTRSWWSDGRWKLRQRVRASP